MSITTEWFQKEYTEFTLFCFVGKVMACVSQELVHSDSKVHGANMGPNWVLSAPDGPHVGPMNFAIWDMYIAVRGVSNEYALLLIYCPKYIHNRLVMKLCMHLYGRVSFLLELAHFRTFANCSIKKRLFYLTHSTPTLHSVFLFSFLFFYFILYLFIYFILFYFILFYFFFGGGVNKLNAFYFRLLIMYNIVLSSLSFDKQYCFWAIATIRIDHCISIVIKKTSLVKWAPGQIWRVLFYFHFFHFKTLPSVCVTNRTPMTRQIPVNILHNT